MFEDAEQASPPGVCFFVGGGGGGGATGLLNKGGGSNRLHNKLWISTGTGVWYDLTMQKS